MVQNVFIPTTFESKVRLPCSYTDFIDGRRAIARVIIIVIIKRRWSKIVAVIVILVVAAVIEIRLNRTIFVKNVC